MLFPISCIRDDGPNALHDETLNATQRNILCWLAWQEEIARLINAWTVTKDGWATANNGFCSAGFMIYFVALCNWNSKQRVPMMKFIRWCLSFKVPFRVVIISLLYVVKLQTKNYSKWFETCMNAINNICLWSIAVMSPWWISRFWAPELIVVYSGPFLAVRPGLSGLSKHWSCVNWYLFDQHHALIRFPKRIKMDLA